MSPSLSQVQGLALGLTIGDYFGAPLEFMLYQEFKEVADKFPNGVITQPTRNPKVKPSWKFAYLTDDSHWNELCFRSYIETKTFDMADISARGVKWYDGGAGEGLGGSTAIACWLMDPQENPNPVPWFEAGRKAREISPFVHKGRNNENGYKIRSAPSNGPLMRGAIVGLLGSGEKLRQMSRDLTILTHDFEENYQTSELLAFTIEQICTGKSKSEILQTLNEQYGDVIEMCQQSLAPNIGEAMDELKDYDGVYPEVFGYGGAATTTMAIVLDAFFKTDSFEEAIIYCVNARTKVKPWCWDVDTYAAICGAVAGCYYGVEAIPQKWREPIHPVWNKPEPIKPFSADYTLKMAEDFFNTLELNRRMALGL